MIARIKKYLREIRLEWGKVTKPDRKDVQGNTIIVVIACAMCGVFLFLVDGSTKAPEWLSIHGIILLAALVVCIAWIAKRFTPKWKIVIPIALVPLVIVIFSYFVLDHSVKGFGLALLRSWFIRAG